MFRDRIEFFKQWWRNAPPKTKRTALLSGLVIAIGVILLVANLFSGPKRRRHKVPKPEIEILSKKAKEELIESSSVRRLREKVFSMEKDVQDLKNEVKALKHSIEELNKRMESYTAEVTQIKFDTRQQQQALIEALQKIKQQEAKKKRVQKEKKGTTGGFSTLWGKPPVPPLGKSGKWAVSGLKTGKGRGKGGGPSSVFRRSRRARREEPALVREVPAEERPQKAPSPTKRTMTVHIPAGSYFRGILMNGVDAPVSVVAKKNPYPVLIKIKTEAWLPNEYRYDVKGCYVIAAAWGDMSAERAYFRTERLSCIFKTAGVIETALDASVIDGQDGKLGVFGRLVTKNGSLIARSLLAGIASGLSKVLTPRQTLPVVNLGEGNQEKLYVSPPVGQSLEYGFYSGIGKAAERIADYYLKMAEQTFPVIELKAGTPVEVFLLRGLTLTLKNPKIPQGVRP